MLALQNDSKIWPLILFIFFSSLDKCRLSHLPILNTSVSFVAVLAAAWSLPDRRTAAWQSKCQALQVAHRTQTHVPVLLHR